MELLRLFSGNLPAMFIYVQLPELNKELFIEFLGYENSRLNSLLKTSDLLQFTKKNVFQESFDTQKEFHSVCFLVFQVKQTITQKFSSSGASIVTTLVNMYRIILANSQTKSRTDEDCRSADSCNDETGDTNHDIV